MNNEDDTWESASGLQGAAPIVQEIYNNNDPSSEMRRNTIHPIKFNYLIPLT